MAAGAANREVDPTPDVVWGLLMAARSFARAAQPIVQDVPGGQRGHLLLATVARGQTRSQLALAHLLAVDKTAMTYLLDELEGAGLVQRCTDPDDRRARQVAITTKGKRLLTRISHRLEDETAELLSKLTDEEQTVFRSAVERLGWCSEARAADTTIESALGQC